jgi:hypothetical protein
MSSYYLKRSLLKMIPATLIMCWTLSCSDFLEEDLSTVMCEKTLFNSEESMMAALAGVYKPMSHTWRSGYANSFTLAVLMGSDDLTSPKFMSKSDYRDFDQFMVGDWNQCLSFIWNGAYKSIQGANFIIANYQNARVAEEAIRQMAGEAYFLRAYNYFWIVRLWKDAPLILESQTFNASDLSIPRSPASEIYSRIIEDLQQAEILLANQKPEPGRVGKGTAKALLAEVYLTMAGWPIKDRSYYPKAASKAKEVLDNLESFGFGLMEDFADLWPDDDSNNDGNKEEVFALNFWGEWWNANAIYGMNARPVEDDGWANVFTELTFFNEFPEGYRKEITFLTVLEDGTQWEDFQTERPHYAKLRGPEPEWQNIISLPLERLAEVYLVFAEAQIMASGNSRDPDALEAVNKIVRRGAGLPPDEPNGSVDWVSATQEQIVREKGWEFAGEFCRWFDLIRLEMVEEVVAKKHPDDMQPLGPISYTFPVPKTDAEINQNLSW